MNKEFRTLEMRALDNEENKMVIEGYAITFNAPATHFGMTEIIDSRALDNCDMSDVPLKYNHDDSHMIMARTRNGSLKLEKDDIGLKIHAELIDTQSNRDIYTAIKSGLLDKMSFAFTVQDEDYDYNTDTRTVLSIDKLYDVSVVDVPYYDTTSVYARNLDSSEEYAKQKHEEKRQMEQAKQLEERKALLEKLERAELLNKLK